MIVAGEIPDTGKVIDFPWAETKRLTGVVVHPVEQKVILQTLGFHVSGAGDHVKVSPPSWRPDVEGKSDLVEEVIRITGLDKVKPEPLPAQLAVNGPVLTLLQRRTRAAKRVLAGRGLMEAVTWTFISEAQAKLFGRSANMLPVLKLSNPIAADLSDMRPSLLPGLLTAAQRNADRGFGDGALFEVGQIYQGDGDTDQKIAAACVRRGMAKASGIGLDSPPMSMSSTPRRTLLPCSRVLAFRSAACRSCPAAPPGCIRAAPPRCSSARRTPSAASARCIRRC
jgi:phenylalanyl-tRNA synthetase beta chain